MTGESLLKDVEKLWGAIIFILKNGLYWHFLSGAFFWVSWGSWPTDVKIGLVTAFVLACFLSLYYPYLWKRYREDQEAKYRAKFSEIDNAKSCIKLLYDARDKQAWPDGLNHAWETLYIVVKPK